MGNEYMSENNTENNENFQRAADETITDFVSRFTCSKLFSKTFHEGMTLVEDTARYLDGQGRADSKTLSKAGALTYAAHSMRLTTRLMQMASWLLVQRAINEGELPIDEVKKNKYRLTDPALLNCGPMDGDDELPEQLKQLIKKSQVLYKRINRLDTLLHQKGPIEDAINPVNADIDRLHQAFTPKA